MCMLCLQVHILHVGVGDLTLPESVVWTVLPYRFRRQLCHANALPHSFRWAYNSNFIHSLGEKVKRSYTICPTCTGQLHIQMKGASGESAFTSTFRVPLNRWCQISLTIQGATVSGHMLIRRLGSSQVVNKVVVFTASQATVSMLCADEEQRTFVSLEHT